MTYGTRPGGQTGSCTLAALGSEADVGVRKEDKDELDAVQIGQRYIEHLVGEGDFVKAPVG